MRGRLWCGLVCLLLAEGMGLTVADAQTQPNASRTEKQNACADAARLDYNKRLVALLEREKPLPSITSVETILAIRRLEEDFCLRFTRCVLDDQNTVDFSVAFHICLKDEALEKYDAVPRDEVPDED